MRTFKKISAIVVAIAMVLSLVSFSAFAAGHVLSYSFKDGDTVVTEAKAGKTLKVEITLPVDTYSSVGFELDPADGITIESADITMNAAYKGIATVKSRGSIYFEFTNEFTVVEGTPLGVIEVTIPEVEAGDLTVFEMTDFSYTTTTPNYSPDYTNATIKVLESFVAAEAALTDTSFPTSYEIGTDVLAELADVDITVSPAEGDGETGYKATWAAPAEFDNTVPGEYVFTGTVVGPDDAKAATWTGDLTTTVTVTLDPLTDGTVDALPSVTATATKVDADYDAAAAKAGILAALDADAIVLNIKNGDIEDTIAVEDAWITTTDFDTTVVADNADAITVTIPAETESANGKFVLDAEKVLTTNVNNIAAIVDYEDAQAKVPSSIDVESGFKVTVTLKDVAEADRAIKVIVNYNGSDYEVDGTILEGEKEATISVESIAALIFGEDYTKENIETLKEAEVTITVECDGSVVKPDADSENTTATIEEVPKSSKAPNGVGKPMGNGTGAGVTPSTPSTPSTPVEPENPDTPVEPENPDVPGTEVPVVTGTFSDVPATHWAYEAIEKLAAAGIINGVGDGTFNVDGNVTRAEFAKMVVVAMGIEATATESAFEDCVADAWYTPYVVAAAEAGYVTGISETYFGAEELISRQDICTILGRVLAVESEVAAEFIDADQIADYAAKYVNALVEMGIINGYEDGSFRPEANATRAEAAKIINGVFDLVAKIIEAE